MIDPDGEELLPAEDDVVIVDDNAAPPEQERRRMPLEGLEPGDEEFSRNTQKRIAKAFGRAKAAESAVERERGARVAAERRLAELERVSLDATETSLSRDLDAANARYQRAFTDADVDSLTAANADVAELTARRLEIQQAKQRVETTKGEPQNQQNSLTPETKAYIAENQWFTNDPAARQAAIVAHQGAARRGIKVDTPEYFEHVTKSVRQQFPEHFDDGDADEEEAAPPPRRSALMPPIAAASRSTVGSPASRNRLPSLTATEARIAESLGQTPRAYAEQKAKLIAQGKISK